MVWDLNDFASKMATKLSLQYSIELTGEVNVTAGILADQNKKNLTRKNPIFLVLITRQLRSGNDL